jgi:hypothetical protein
MALLALPQEIILYIATQLDFRDLAPLLQVNCTLYNLLSPELYKRDVKTTGGRALLWYTERGLNPVF